jgi:hypothetical protein
MADRLRLIADKPKHFPSSFKFYKNMTTVKQILNAVQTVLVRCCATIVDECASFEVNMAKLPRFAELFVEMQDLLDQIDAATDAKYASKDTRPVTAQKNAYIADFIGALDELSALTYLIGTEKGNSEWQTQSEAGLRANTSKAAEETLFAVARLQMTLTRTIDAKILAHYGISEKKLTDFEAKMALIKTGKQLQKAALGQKVASNQTLAELCNKLRKTRDTMTLLAGFFRDDNPDFYAVYMAAQKEEAKPRKKVDEPKSDALKTLADADKKESKKDKSAKSKAKSKKKSKKADKAAKLDAVNAETPVKIEAAAESASDKKAPQ